VASHSHGSTPSSVGYGHNDLVLCVLDVFFFSSRRRHTRCYRDWSSDVCSSDLAGRSVISGVPAISWWVSPSITSPQKSAWRLRRSEERRVGKECRSRWSPDHERKKDTGKRRTSSRFNIKTGQAR